MCWMACVPLCGASLGTVMGCSLAGHRDRFVCTWQYGGLTRPQECNCHGWAARYCRHHLFPLSVQPWQQNMKVSVANSTPSRLHSHISKALEGIISGKYKLILDEDKKHQAMKDKNCHPQRQRQKTSSSDLCDLRRRILCLSKTSLPIQHLHCCEVCFWTRSPIKPFASLPYDI